MNVPWHADRVVENGLREKKLNAERGDTEINKTLPSKPGRFIKDVSSFYRRTCVEG